MVFETNCVLAEKMVLGNSLPTIWGEILPIYSYPKLAIRRLECRSTSLKSVIPLLTFVSCQAAVIYVGIRTGRSSIRDFHDGDDSAGIYLCLSATGLTDHGGEHHVRVECRSLCHLAYW